VNRNSGLMAAFLMVLTVLGVSTFSRSPVSAPPAGRKESAAGMQGAPASDTGPYLQCRELRDRLMRFTEADASRRNQWRLPKSCYPSQKLPGNLQGVSALKHVQFVLAAVPNPVSTHLPLFFDRLVESIQQAAQDDGYSYDDSWFPWSTNAKDYSSYSDQQEAEEQQRIQDKQPGVMVFRNSRGNDPYESGLVVFVVGEQPTGGISDEQFQNALDWIDFFGGYRERKLRVLGPAFSGSIPSLQHNLSAPAKGGLKIEISSGTVSSAPSFLALKAWADALQNGSTVWTATESDDRVTERFCRYIAAQGYATGHVAFLSEDETAFGADRKQDEEVTGSSRGCPEALRFYYPRDIATLRSAYERQSILSPPKPDQNSEAPSTTLRGDLSEPSTGEHDSVRRFGGQVTPLAQEAILLDIASRLEEKRVQFVIVRSTSSLDQIFLAEFLHRAYSGARVVIDGSDLLFTRGAEGKLLRGVMLLSTYPLLVWEHDWTALPPGQTSSYRSFGDGTSEGEYIAARGLFHEFGRPTPFPDYAPPMWLASADQPPATWVTVVGHRQFWPIAALNTATAAQSILLTYSERHGRALAGHAETQPFDVPTGMWILVLLCLCWSFVHAYFCWSACIMGSPRARVYFAPVAHRQHPWLIALGTLLAGMVPITVTVTSGLFFGSLKDHPVTAATLAVLLALGFTVPLAASVRNYALPPLPADSAVIGYWHGTGALLGFVGALALMISVHWYLGHNLTNENAIPAFLRSVHLGSGVSPLLPQLFLLAGGYLWFWCSLRGLAHFGGDRPTLPTECDLPGDGARSHMPMFSSEKAGAPVEKVACPLNRDYLLLLLGIFVATVLICSMSLQGCSLRTLGERAFGRLIFFWVCLYVAVILTDGLQMWRTWSKHRELLIHLDRLPLRRSIRALKGLAWGSIWKMSGNVLGERYRVITFQLESLRHLRNSLSHWDPGGPENLQTRRCLLEKLCQCDETVRDFARWYVDLQGRAPISLKPLRDLQKEFASTAGMVMQGILLPEWRHEKRSLIFDRAREDDNAAAKDKGDDGGSQESPPPQLHLQAAEEFCVLPYLAFIQNILGRIRTMALGSLWLFVAATLAMSSYPFEPLDVLAGIFLALFLIYGSLAALIYAQMSRDATLSHITKTEPGSLGWDFWGRVVTFGAGPLFGLLTTLFPSITDFVFSWLQPGAQALK